MSLKDCKLPKEAQYTANILRVFISCTSREGRKSKTRPDRPQDYVNAYACSETRYVSRQTTRFQTAAGVWMRKFKAKRTTLI